MSRAVGPALLLDEMFSPVIAQQLCERGHDVLAVAADPRLGALSDADLYEWTRSHGRRLVTENLTSLPRLKSWDSRVIMRRPVGFALHRVPYFGMSLHAL